MSAEVLLAIVTGALLSAGILALLNGWLSGRAGIDENLRSKRLDLYPTLWSITAAVSVCHATMSPATASTSCTGRCAHGITQKAVSSCHSQPEIGTATSRR